MSQHLDEHTIELYVLDPAVLDADVCQRVKQHLAECAACADLEQRFRSFYAEVERELQKPPTDRDAAFSDSLLAPRRRSLPERGLEHQSARVRDSLEKVSSEVSTPSPSFLRRVTRVIRTHPVRSGVFATFAAAAIVALFSLFKPGTAGNPTFLKVDKGLVSVFGEQGELLWQKLVTGIPDGRSDVAVSLDLQEKRYFSITDIDGNGRNVVLLSGPTPASRKAVLATDTLYCYEGDGTLRWRAGAGSLAVFGESGKAQSTRKLFVDWTTVQRKDHPPKLFAIARDYSYSPAKVAEIDARTGRELSSYHNRGHAQRLLATDVTNDGNEELVWGGINDAYNNAFVAVLDPHNVKGHAPVPDMFHPVSEPAGSEMYYILFPQSPVGKALSTAPYNATNVITPREGGGFNVGAVDFISPQDETLNGSILYSFNSSLRCESSITGDGWIGAAQRAKHLGFDILLEAERVRTFKDSLMYWNGDGFVNTPTRVMRHGKPAHLGG